MINPLHDSYNEEFASVYQALEADPSVTYRFERWNEFHINKEGKATSGGTTLADDRAVVIGYTWGLETTINKENTPSRALCEEICHAKQFCDGKWGFAKTHGVLWVTCGNVDEEEAHIWAEKNYSALLSNKAFCEARNKIIEYTGNTYVPINTILRTAPEYGSVAFDKCAIENHCFGCLYCI